MEFFLKQLDALTHLDVREPGALVLYFGILGILVYQYYREGADVFREYGRLHREIVKEDSLKALYTDEWKHRIVTATHLFNLGNWLIFASFLLLFQFVGLMIMLQVLPSQSNSNMTPPRSSASFSTTVVVTAATPAANATAVVIDPSVGMERNTTAPTQREPRAEAQRLLGMGFIVFCIVVALLVNRAKYTALRTMYEFGNQ